MTDGGAGERRLADALTVRGDEASERLKKLDRDIHNLYWLAFSDSEPAHAERRRLSQEMWSGGPVCGLSPVAPGPVAEGAEGSVGVAGADGEGVAENNNNSSGAARV